MKILANRGPEDTEKIEVDLNDAVALMKVTKIMIFPRKNGQG
jgi:hypothetical protein